MIGTEFDCSPGMNTYEIRNGEFKLAIDGQNPVILDATSETEAKKAFFAACEDNQGKTVILFVNEDSRWYDLWRFDPAA